MGNDIKSALERRKAELDPHFFIFDSGYLKTKDEHDSANSVKSVPDFPYLRVILDTYLVGSKFLKPEQAKYALANGISLDFLQFLYESGVLFIEKSRDLFVTNITCCFIHWRAKFKAHQLILVQSKNEEDAANLVYNKDADVARLSFQEDHLPEGIKTCNVNKAGSYCNLYWPTGSRCRAIPEGARVIRSEHPSVVFSDEGAFQDEFSGSFTAALPAVQGGGFYLSVSSANPGDFANLVKPDSTKQTTKILGLTYRIVDGSLPVLRVHYSAHPERVPGTEVGDKWREITARRYPGGIESPRWRKEQEIDYYALSGQKLIPNWEIWQHSSNIVVGPYDPIDYDLYGSFDYGYRNPACYLVHGVDRDGVITTLWEFYSALVEVSYIAEIIKGKDVILPDGRRFPGNPYAGREKYKVADPQMWAKDQVSQQPNYMGDKTQKSISEIFLKCGVVFQRGERGGDTTVANWLLGHFWKDPNKPLYRITRNCQYLIWELGVQRFKEFSVQVGLNRDQPEELIDKDNHAWDSLKMFLKKFPPAALAKKAEKVPNTFNWWKKASKGEAQGTFSIRRELNG